MNNYYKIIHIEDNPADAELIRIELETNFPKLTLVQVHSVEEFNRMSQEFSADLVLSDFNVAGYSGMDIFSQFAQSGHQIPFVFVSGTINGPTALEIMRSGVTDYVMKDNLPKLPFVITRAITEFRENRKKKRAEELLQESERRYRSLFENINEGLLYVRHNGLIEMANPSFTQIVGYPIRKIIGMDIRELIMYPEQDQWVHSIENIVIPKISRQNEVRLKNAGGSAVWTLLNATPYFDSENQFLGTMYLVTDISERKQAEQRAEDMQRAFTEELERKVVERTMELDTARKELAASLDREKELNMMKSRFVSTASHQFRTPLSVIQSSMGVLSMYREKMGPDIRNSFDTAFQRIRTQVEHITNLMNDVLSLGKINEGNVRARFEPHDIVQICTNLVNNYNVIQTDENQMEIIVSGTQRELLLDANLMEHAISNLVSNAFKYSLEGKNPRLELEFQNHQVIIRVIDRGLGIPKHVLSRIFEPFFRADNVREIPGTGLGTTISKEYVEMNGGVIHVESKPNHGTKFTIELPYRETAD